MSSDLKPANFNPDFLLEQVGHDKALLKQILDMFVQEYPARLAMLKKAVADNSGTSLYEAAHYLKGEFLAIGYQPAVDLSAQLEALGKASSMTGATQLIDQLDKSLQIVIQFASTTKP